MIEYRVVSGDMDEVVATPYQATAEAIVFRALGQMLDEPIVCFGTLIEISGGQFVGDNVTYMAADRVMRDAGLLKPEPIDPELLELMKLGERKG